MIANLNDWHYADRPKVLTKRQWDIVLMYVEGLTWREIATELRISDLSAHQHRQKIMTRLRLTDHRDIPAAVQVLVEAA